MAWTTPEPGRLVGRGHPAGDFLEAWAWEVLDEDVGYLRVSAHLPDHVKNPRGQLFGGFTPTYVDLIALFTARAGPGAQAPRDRQRQWMATTSMHLDYFEPVMGPTFVLDSRLEKKRGERTSSSRASCRTTTSPCWRRPRCAPWPSTDRSETRDAHHPAGRAGLG